MRELVRLLLLGAASRLVLLAVAFGLHGVIVNADTSGQLRDSHCRSEAAAKGSQDQTGKATLQVQLVAMMYWPVRKVFGLSLKFETLLLQQTAAFQTSSLCQAPAGLFPKA